MIPLRLKLSGFLSYRDPVDVDFTSFDLACISGQNGAGKSSLLDAFTWALFGEARKRGEELIHTTSQSAEVALTFAYEENVYRIRRILGRGKSTVLEFQIADHRPSSTVNGQFSWRPLTEATSRATQARIESILRLDYDTFVNASFFLQGKADQFTQQKASERKRILGSILGLELWETYKTRAAERRKAVEAELNTLDGRLAEISAELGEEGARRERLQELESRLRELETARAAQEAILKQAEKIGILRDNQRKQVETLGATLERSRRELNLLTSRLAARETESAAQAGLVNRAADIEARYRAWEAARAALAQWETVAGQFRQAEKRRQPFLDAINAEKARLEQERQLLSDQLSVISEQFSTVESLQAQKTQFETALAASELKLKQRSEVERQQSIVARFREQAKLRQQPLDEINAERARLEQEIKTLKKQREVAESQRLAIQTLQNEQNELNEKLAEIETLLSQRFELDESLQLKRHRQIELRSENERLKVEMEQLDERIKKLETTEGAVCPLCGQPLNQDERIRLTADLKFEGKSKGDQYRSNKSEIDSIVPEIARLEKEIMGFSRVEKDKLFHVTALAKASERVQANQQTVNEWETQGDVRLTEITHLLENALFSPQSREALALIDQELWEIGKSLGLKPSLRSLAGPEQGKTVFDLVEEKVAEIETQLSELSKSENERVENTAKLAQITEKINAIQHEIATWQSKGQPRIQEIESSLEGEKYALEPRQFLAAVDAELKILNYDLAAHEAARLVEQEGRVVESEFRALEAARAALAPLERETTELRVEIQNRQSEIDHQEDVYAQAVAALQEAEAQTPDLANVEREFFRLKEAENVLNQQVGMAQQMVSVLEARRKQKKQVEGEREACALEIGRYKTLERAFGKDGVPALLIEQALPQIEEKANELLDRLSNGAMSVRFVTQAGYKDKKREDLKETLDIQISDGAGTRDYEMFSGGEAFRVNFAIRLALSEVLARRTGARLQTLVIDEGFGSQDALGRQRLVEAINTVRRDFAKILIITHLDELKDAFPNRIEVEKTPRGSSVRVM